MNSKTISKGAIIATLGPASDSEEILKGMIKAGLDVVRLNMSHGDHEDHKKRFEMVRAVDDTVPILLDLSGPKIRIGQLKNPVLLKPGDMYTLTREKIIGDETKASLLYENLIDEVDVGKRLFLNDGLLEFCVTEKKANELICEVITGGTLSSRKGVNTPGTKINLFAPTDKDLNDIDFTIDLEPDFYSVSFVRRLDDLLKVKERISQYTTENIPLISKIEHADGLDNIDDIIKNSEGIMVARGDLGVELPLEDIPVVQRDLVKRCNFHSKTSIVATQMLESMVTSMRPTRAEVSDVAAAISQGSDAVMLSAETATGMHPVEAIKVMERIILKAQNDVRQQSKARFDRKPTIAESIGRAAVSIAHSIQADRILAFTQTGLTSRVISRFKPEQEIIAITPLKKTARRTRLQWGVTSVLNEKQYTNSEEMIYCGVKKVFEEGLIDHDSNLVLVAGTIIGKPTTTNLIKCVRTSELLDFKN